MSKARIYGMPSKGVPNKKAPNPIRGANPGGQNTIMRFKPRKRG